MVPLTVLSATMNRERFMPGLYANFLRQTHPDKRLYVLDNSPAPSPFFRRIQRHDARVAYAHDPKRRSLGSARNVLAKAAFTPHIAFFDDDDFYGASYLETMVAPLHAPEGADLAKLSAFYLYSLPEQLLFHWDTPHRAPTHFEVGRGPAWPAQRVTTEGFDQGRLDEFTYGYGFSWVCRRELFERVQCEDHNYAEDRLFVEAARRDGARIHLHPNTLQEPALMVHVLHGTNGSWCYPQTNLGSGTPESLDRTAPGFEDHLRRLESSLAG